MVAATRCRCLRGDCGFDSRWIIGSYRRQFGATLRRGGADSDGCCGCHLLIRLLLFSTLLSPHAGNIRRRRWVVVTEWRRTEYIVLGHRWIPTAWSAVWQPIPDGLNTGQLVKTWKELRYIVHHVRNWCLRSIAGAILPLAQDIDENLILCRIGAIGDSYIDEKILTSL